MNKNIDNDDMNNIQDADEFYDGGDLPTVTLTDDSGNDMVYLVLDSVKQEGKSYLLVTDEDYDDESDEESEINILKEVSSDDESFVYSFLEDEDEIKHAIKLFSLDDEDYEIML